MQEGDQMESTRHAQQPPPLPNPSDLFQTMRFSAGTTGVAASVLLHFAILLLLLFCLKKLTAEQPALQRIVPVDLVALSQGPAAQPAQQKSAGVRSAEPRVLRAPVVHRAPTGVAPARTTEPPDELELQLKALSKLRRPNTDPRLAGNAGTADPAQNGDENFSGGRGAYASRDIIRAQILRRWNLDMARLGNRNFDILIRVLLKRDGTVLEADIMDRKRYATDSVYRWIALSAKNAILLSSPLALPSGLADENLDVTLQLNPRDTMQ